MSRGVVVGVERLVVPSSLKLAARLQSSSEASGPVWYAKCSLPDGRQAQKRIALPWTRSGRPEDGFVNRRGAEAWLCDVLAQAHAGTPPGTVRTGVTFAFASSEWLRYCVEDRACKPSTMVDYRHAVDRVLVPVFGELLLEDISAPAIEAWRASTRPPPAPA
jgi:integrase